MKKIIILSIVGLVVLLLLIQFVPVRRTNPPGGTATFAPPEAVAVFKRACFDCHSNETVWPWYSRVAPVSWLVAHDVKEGREKLNFSNWDLLEMKKRPKMMHEIWEMVEQGEMPLWYYLPAHPEARLSTADLGVIRAWVATAGPLND
jgi:mono/diheme cytochrome c family protein